MCGPSIALICVEPFPTTPKFSPCPTARIFGAWGDHFTLVIANFSFMPTARSYGLSIVLEL